MKMPKKCTLKNKNKCFRRKNIKRTSCAEARLRLIAVAPCTSVQNAIRILLV